MSDDQAIEPEGPKPWLETKELTAADRDLSRGGVNKVYTLALCLYHPTEPDHAHDQTGRIVYVTDLRDRP